VGAGPRAAAAAVHAAEHMQRNFALLQQPCDGAVAWQGVGGRKQNTTCAIGNTVMRLSRRITQSQRAFMSNLKRR
jgi:hypothetical protein